MKTIFVVEGSTGEYSDHYEWPVCAFVDEKKAADLVVKAQARANELFAQYCAGNRMRYDEIPEEANEFDLRMHADYTGVRYRYFPVTLVDG